METTTPRRLSYEAFEQLDADGVEPRLEYLDGSVFAQAEPSRAHQDIASNLSLALGPAVRASGCRFFTRGSVWIEQRNSELKPDWMVLCDERDLFGLGKEKRRSRFRFPRVVVEVLSPSNTATEMLRKFTTYETVASIEWYLLVDSIEQRVWSYRRGETGFIADPEVATLDTPFGTITLDQLYADTGVPLPS